MTCISFVSYLPSDCSYNVSIFESQLHTCTYRSSTIEFWLSRVILFDYFFAHYFCTNNCIIEVWINPKNPMVLEKAGLHSIHNFAVLPLSETLWSFLWIVDLILWSVNSLEYIATTLPAMDRGYNYTTILSVYILSLWAYSTYHPILGTFLVW